MSVFHWHHRLLRIDPLETGPISDCVYAVRTCTVNFFIYKKGGKTICFDSGYGKRRAFREMSRLGIDPKSVTHLFLTHSDPDHVGALALFKQAKVYLSAQEEQMVLGKKTRMFGLLYNRRLKTSYTLLTDEEVVKVGSIEVQAIATPGHTPGSTSYLVDRTVLLAGDNFALHSMRRFFNMDTELQMQSIGKLAHLLGVQIACTAHSGLTTDFDTAIQDWRQDSQKSHFVQTVPTLAHGR